METHSNKLLNKKQKVSPRKREQVDKNVEEASNKAIFFNIHIFLKPFHPNCQYIYFFLA